MNKIVITGGAGFIGSHLSEKLLNQGNDITIIDNLSTGRLKNIENFINDIKFVQADISKNGNWENEFKNSDFVFHLAALADIVPSIQRPVEYFNSNVKGTLNVLEAAKKNNIGKFIYSASSSCYGVPDKFPTNEDCPTNPLYPYALTKYLGEELVLHWSKVYKIPSISLRFFNVYGPRSRTSGTYGAVFGVFLAQKIANKPFTIVGDGSQTRDFTFVTDVVSALIASAESNINSEVYNVGSGKCVTINYLVDLLVGEKVFIPKRPGEPDCTFADITKIAKDLSWSPTISIEDGVKIMLENIDYWKDAPVWTPETISDETTDWFKYLSKN